MLPFFCSAIQSDTEESADFVCIGRDLTKHKQAEPDRLLATIARQIRQSLKLEEILNTTVAEVRQLLQTDRVVIYAIPSSSYVLQSPRATARGLSNRKELKTNPFTSG